MATPESSSQAKMDSQQEDRIWKRKPAAGPPPSLREKFLKTLPKYTGPHNVGTMEIEMPVREPRTFSKIKRQHDYALRLQTVLFQIYYPCDLESSLTAGEKPSRPTWLPRPRTRTCKGYAKFMHVPEVVTTVYMALTTMFTKLPAFRNAKLADKRTGEMPAIGKDVSLETINDSDVLKPKFPVIVFSHGLGGSRTLYSTVCGELASNGFIVVAMEHRDGSGARSYVNVPPASDMPHGEVDGPIGKTSYLVDYIVPNDNAQDTSPQNAKGVDVELRNAQIEMRMAEIEEAYYILQMINNGQGAEVYKKNLRKKGNVGSSSKGLDGVDWADWTSRMYLEKATIMGHSFGGATSVQVARSHTRFPWISQGVLLDAWGPATPVLGTATTEQLRKPMLVIGSEAFMHWDENFQRMTDVCQEAKDGGSYGWMLSIKGSTHLSQTDFSVLYPHLMSFGFKTMLHPQRAIFLTINTTLEFFQRVLPSTHTAGNAWPDEGILKIPAMAPEDELPTDHKPTDNWVAARLSIPNETRVRLMALVRKRPKAEDVPKDPHGKPLVGVVIYKPGDEVWMHMTPSKDQLERPQRPRGWMSRRSTAHYSFTR